MCLDDFVLKMKQGESVEVRLSNNRLALACPMKVDKDIILVNFLNKRSLKPISEKKDGVLIGDLLISCNQNKILYLNNHFEIRNLINQIANENYSVEDVWNINYTVKDIICSYQGDLAAAKEEQKYFRFRDIHNIKYFDELGWISGDYESLKIPPVVVLSLGINNFAYLQGMFLMRNDLKMENILGYMRYGFEYLKYVPEARNYDIELYKRLYEQYLNVKDYKNEFLEHEIVSRLSEDGKQSVYINGKNMGDFEIKRMEHKVCERKNGRNIQFADINTLRYKGEEIFNKEKELKRLESDEFQAGIKGIIQWIRKKNNYKRFELDLDYESEGDLVYTKQGHFGVVIKRNTVCLDNGRKINIENTMNEDINLGLYEALWKEILSKWKDEVDVLLKEHELNRDLKTIRDFIIENYCKEQVKTLEDTRNR